MHTLASRTLNPAAVLLLSLAGLVTPAAGQSCAGCQHEFDCRLPDMPSDGIYQADRLWPGGTIPYDFNANVSPLNQARARAAMDAIEAVCNARFIPRTTEADYVHLQSDTSSYSEWIGRKGGRQIVGILPWNARYIIVHELMHAMGAWHQNQRSDRDTYITTNFANIAPGQENNFTTRPAAVTMTGWWYDFDSVMHYRRFHFTANGHATIDTKPGYERWKHRIGQVTHLSTGDIWLLTQMYGGSRPPAVFDLSSPANHAAVSAAWSPSFTWTAALEADSYRLLVDTDPYLQTPIIDVTVNATSYSAAPLAANTLYFWTVQAQNAGGITQPWHTPVAWFYTGAGIPAVLYVDDSAPAGGDGASWSTAFRDLQDALALATCAGGSPVEIRIGQGTYTPDRASGDRLASFRLHSNVTLRGGYAGYGAADPNQRNITAFATILSGDLAGNDGPAFANYDENSQHVLWAVGQTSGQITLDGLIVTAGNADGEFLPIGQGGGLYSDDCHLIVSDCTFTLCRGTLEGGAMFLQASEAQFDRCAFVDNAVESPLATRGGGMCIDNNWKVVAFNDCTFTGNQAVRGGGMFVRLSSATFDRADFIDNHAALHGAGAMAIGAHVTLNACQFQDNVADGGFGGGILLGSVGTTTSPAWPPAFVTFGSLVLHNTLIAGNSAPTGGGALSAEGGADASLVNCTIASNTASVAGGLYAIGQYIPPPPGGPAVPTSLAVANSIVHGNAAAQIFVGVVATGAVHHSNVQGGWTGTGFANISADPLFVGPANLSLQPGSPCIDSGNNTLVPAGLLTDLAGNPRFHDDPGTSNSGVAGGAGGPAIIDMGAYEFQGATCYANCDGSTTPPVLNVADFGCFLTRFAAGDSYANCDGSTVPPVLNVADFGCFLTKFAAGCP